MTSSANWVDGVFLAVIAVSAILAFFRGFVREVLSIGAWVGALLAGWIEYQQGMLLVYVQPYVESPHIAQALSIGAVMLAVLIILMVIIHWIANQVQGSVLGGLDRTLGLFFGIARGAILLVVAYIVAGVFLPMTERWPEPVRQSRSLPVIADGAERLVEQLPPEFRPRLPDRTGRPAPSQEELIRPPAGNRT